MEIANMNGSFQGLHMQQMQHAAMLGAGSRPPLEESLTGGALNKVSAIGGPVAGIAGSIAAQSAGFGAFSAARGLGAGFMGAGALGLGAAGAVGAVGMGVGIAGSQMMQGAQQQQGFNASMRQSFQFPNAQGGRGFTRSDLGQMATSMRDMSTSQGPMGEMVGFEELGRLASNMGRMGMAQGVRDAKDFSEKFKQMVSTLKEVATAMSTSLEEAQKFMTSAKQSGVFGGGKVKEFANLIRGGSTAGGLATSELTGMANIGSQISRSIGGRGAAGARGGIETITNIGVAQKMGVLSEEDVYNATGLTGAEGRRALATQQMSQSAKFLKGGLGRRFLASIAGKDGTLNESAVEEYMHGGVGTGRTMQLAQQNLSKTGRADFIRNEGRLRGAALEKFGGLTSSMVMGGWLQERGIDVNEDQDKAMIFMQRRLGMGRDEADAAIKQVKALPQIMREREFSAREDKFSRGVAQRKGSMGIEGLKKKFEKARAEVQSSLQQVGADFYNEMAEFTDRTINELTGDVVQEHRKDVSRLVEQARQGGATGRAAFERAFGSGIVGKGLMASATKAAGSQLDVGQKGLSEFDKRMLGKQGNLTRLQGLKGEALQKEILNVDAMTNAFQTGGAGLEDRESVMAMGEQARSDIRSIFTSGQLGDKKGFERYAALNKAIMDRSKAQKDKGALGQLASRLQAAKTTGERASILASATEGAGVKGEGEMFESAGDLTGLFSEKGFATEGARAESIGERLFGLEKGGASGTAGTLLEKGARGVAGFLDSARTNLRSLFGQKDDKSWDLAPKMDALFGRKDTVSEKMAQAAGKAFMSPEGRKDLADVLSSDATTRQQARDRLEDEMMEIERNGDSMTDDDKGRLGAVKSMLLAQEKAEWKQAGLSDEEIQKKLIERGKDLDVAAESVDRMANVAIAARGADMAKAKEQATAATRREAGRRMTVLRQEGTIARDKEGKLQLSAKTAEKAGAGKDFMTAMVRRIDAESRGEIGTEEWMGAVEQERAGMEGMTVEQKRELARTMGDQLDDRTKGQLFRQASLEERLSKKGSVGQRQAAIAANLGVELSKDELKSDPGKLAQIVAGRTGVEDPAALRDLQTAFQSVKEKGGLGKAAGAVDRLMDAGGEFQKQKLEEKKRQQEEASPIDKDRNESLKSILKQSEGIKSQLVSLNQKMDASAEGGGILAALGLGK